MSLCINPRCPKPSDPLNSNSKTHCRNCGSELFLQKRYQVIRLLSDTSGFGNVYEIEEQGIPKILKILKEHLSVEPKAVELFQKEAVVLSRLRHSGIPRVESDGYFTFLPKNSQQSLHCLVMEKIDGLNLEEWMNKMRNQPIPQEQALDWLKQVTQILDQVHQQDYFHRDIKPPNIMRRPNGQMVLIDFGTAREVTGTYLAKIGGRHNITGIVSLGYTPSEQANGRAVPQSDFFALGRTFVYLLTGKHPNYFSEDPLTGKLIWRESAKSVSKSLADLIDYLMAPFPGNRPQNTEVILQRLREVKQELNPPQSPIQLLQSQPTKSSLPSSLKSSQPIGSTQLNQQKPVSAHSYSDKWLAGGAALLMGLVGISYWQYTQKPLSLMPVITNSSPSPQLKTNQFPMKSQDKGVTLKVLSITKSIRSPLVLNVSLKNEGAVPRRFLYSFLNVTDDQGSALSAITEGLPKEVPAKGKEFFGTISIPENLLKESKSIELSLTDYPDQELRLMTSKIQILR
jgi:serine/threonine protein kinase